MITEQQTQSQQLYSRGKEVMGAGAGGLITKLLKAQGGTVALARAVIEIASTKTDPSAYVGAVIHAKNKGLRDKGEAW